MQSIGPSFLGILGNDICQENIWQKRSLLQDFQVCILLAMPHPNLRDSLRHCHLLEALRDALWAKNWQNWCCLRMVWRQTSQYLYLHSIRILVSPSFQYFFRDNRPFGFLYRKISNLHISWLMNVIVIYIFVKLFKGLGWNLTTFGLFGIGESRVSVK